MIEINKIYQEPCLNTVARMDDNSIDCVITSPPYWQLRDYGYEGQWGLEPTYQEYLENLWSLMDAIYPKLKDGGTVWVNLGDTYSGSGGSGGDYNEGGLREGQPKVRPSKVEIKNKCLLLIPHRFAIGCIDRGWIVRNDIIWAKRNGMPESVKDRFSKKHEYFFFMVKSEKYYFDLDAVRDKHKQVSIERLNRGVSDSNKWINGADGQTPHGLSQPRPNVTTKIPKEQAEMFGSPRARQHRTRETQGYSSASIGAPQQDTNGGYPRNVNKGKNPGSVSDFWDIPTKPSSAKHYATYNDSLLVKPILAGCPKGGIIYDPFMGTGSTAEAAIRAGRRFIGSEMSEDYVKIAEERLDPYLRQLTLF
jgi:DNA modification methylase